MLARRRVRGRPRGRRDGRRRRRAPRPSACGRARPAAWDESALSISPSSRAPASRTSAGRSPRNSNRTSGRRPSDRQPLVAGAARDGVPRAGTVLVQRATASRSRSRVSGFVEIVVDPGRQAALGFTFQGIGRQRHDGRGSPVVRQHLLGADLAGQFEAVHVGHVDVESGRHRVGVLAPSS